MRAYILTFGIKGCRRSHRYALKYEIYISTTSACSSKAEQKPAGTLIVWLTRLWHKQQSALASISKMTWVQGRAITISSNWFMKRRRCVKGKEKEVSYAINLFRNYDPLWGLSTKGKNRMRFINKLRNNISRCLVHLPKLSKWQPIRHRAHARTVTNQWLNLKQVFGIPKLFSVYKIEKSVPAGSAVQEIMQKSTGRDDLQFLADSDHTFELDSRELNQTGGAVFEVLPSIKPKWKNRISTLQVEIREEVPTYISYETVGEQVVCRLELLEKACFHAIWWDWFSVTWLPSLEAWCGHRGLHFASPPYTSPGALKKAHDLTRKLTKFGAISSLSKYLYWDSDQSQGMEALSHDPDPSLLWCITDRIRPNPWRPSHHQWGKSWS